MTKWYGQPRGNYFTLPNTVAFYKLWNSTSPAPGCQGALLPGRKHPPVIKQTGDAEGKM